MKLFLDTNVILDFLDANRRPFHASAKKIFESIALGTAQGLIATSQATDLHYILRNVTSDGDAREKLTLLFGLCELFPTPAFACTMALHSSMPDFEDAVQAETARIAGCDYIVTRDLGDYADSPVPAIDPTGLIARLDSSVNE